MGKTIATIYFYAISAGAIVLMVIATFSWANLILNLTQFEKYPPRFGPPIADCEDSSSLYKYAPYVMPMAAPADSREIPATSSAEEKAKFKANCEKQLELNRKTHKVDDIKNALTFSLVGIILFLIHFPQARKQSRG